MVGYEKDDGCVDVEKERERERERERKRKGENEVSAITKQNLQYTDEYEM